MSDPKFIVVSRGGSPSETNGTFTLQEDNWDDFNFRTSFVLLYTSNGVVREVGYVKIARKGMAKRDPLTALPRSFRALNEEYFSLGQDREYYEALNALPQGVAARVLVALRDVAANSALYRSVEEEPVFQASLLRDVPRRTVETQFRQIIAGHEPLTPFRFSFTRHAVRDGTPPFRIEFSVDPESKPPTNLQVLIGANGVGKSQLFRDFLLAAAGRAGSSSGLFHDEIITEQHAASPLPFSNVVHVSFSAFDPSTDVNPAPNGLRPKSVGLFAMEGVSLEDQFVDSLRLCSKGPRRLRWLAAIRTLINADPLLGEQRINELFDRERPDLDPGTKDLFSRLSSGHKIVVLSITRLVELVEERTLVLMDEPETHLHPPLLSAFVRAVSDLMMSRNGVAIIATHSPVVLQEVPRKSVHVLRRAGDDLRVQPLDTESFGESASRLTAEVFHLDVRRTGYHQVLRDLLEANRGSSNAVLAELREQLGAEGRFVLHALAREVGDQ